MLQPSPVAPALELGSIAGYTYYLCDSSMLKDSEGLSKTRRPGRDRVLRGVNNSHVFDRMAGVSGVGRIGVDYVRNIERKATWRSGLSPSKETT